MVMQIEWTSVTLRSWFLHMRNALSTNESGSLLWSRIVLLLYFDYISHLKSFVFWGFFPQFCLTVILIALYLLFYSKFFLTTLLWVILGDWSLDWLIYLCSYGRWSVVIRGQIFPEATWMEWKRFWKNTVWTRTPHSGRPKFSFVRRRVCTIWRKPGIRNYRNLFFYSNA